MKNMFHSVLLLGFIAIFSVAGFALYQGILGWVYPHVIVTDGTGLLAGSLFNALSFFALSVTIAWSYSRNANNGLNKFFWATTLLILGLGTVWLVLGYMRSDLATVETVAKGFGPIQMSIENIKIYLAPIVSIVAIVLITFSKDALLRRYVVS